jgi:hypothetical protein
MRHRWVGLLLAGIAPIVGAGPGGDAPIATNWTVGVKTSGGFVGVGRGSILVSSDGKAMLRPAARPKQPVDSCEGRLSEAELRRIAAAVKGARPEAWKAAGLDAAAPDAFGYALELRQDESVHRVAWYDNTAQRLPADLKELYAGVQAAWDRLRPGCDGSLSLHQGSTLTRKPS